MTKLPNRKGFTFSDPLEIIIGGVSANIANLLKPTSRAIHETIILISDGKIWHEINVLDHGGDTSDLEAFGRFVNIMNLNLSDFGIITDNEEPVNSFMDYIELAKHHKPHGYLDIEKLHKYLQREQLPSHKQTIKETIRYIDNKGINISKYIEETEASKQSIINGYKPQNSETMNTKKTAPEMLKESIQNAEPPIEEVVDEIPKMSASDAFGENENLPDLPIGPEGQTYIPDAITEASAEVTTLANFGSINVSSIKELKGLKAETESIIKKYPVIEVTDDETLAVITKSINEVRKHCTTLDGKTGVLENAKKFLNTLKSNIDLVVSDAVKPRRELLAKLEASKLKYEEAEELRLAEERRKELEVVTERQNRIFELGGTFDGTNYIYGSKSITPGLLVSDISFLNFIKEIEIEKQAQKLIADELASKDAEIEKLRKLLALAGMTTETVEPSSNEVVEPKQSEPGSTPEPATQGYQLPTIEHKPLNRYDLENTQHLENPAFQKARVIFAKGCSYTADSILKILEDGGKSQAIKDFCAVLKQPIT